MDTFPSLLGGSVCYASHSGRSQFFFKKNDKRSVRCLQGAHKGISGNGIFLITDLPVSIGSTFGDLSDLSYNGFRPYSSKGNEGGESDEK